MIPLLETGGSPLEIGFDIGKRFRGQIRFAIRSSGVDFANAGDDVACERVQPFIDATAQSAPEILDEISGMADGAGVTVDGLFLLNAAAELHQQQNRLVECTVAGVTARGTMDGTTLVAHNEDGIPGWDALTYLIKAEPGGRPSFVAITYAGLLLHQGVNTAGIAAVGNALYSRDAHSGIPKLLQYRRVMGESTIDGAVMIVTDERRAYGNNRLIASSSGDLYDFEVTGLQWRMLHGGNRFLVHANHLVHPDLAKLDKDEDLTNSRFRQNRLQQLIEQRFGALSAECLRSLMADHANFPKSICKHRDAETNPDVVTIGSVVIDVSNRQRWAGAGNPSCEEWRHDCMQ
jgi:isopenicillin-N N-acyltransferase like protein